MQAARLEVTGWFGAVASTHWLASQTAMGVLERGGNAFDAAVAAGFVMQVAQPHLNGPAGDLALLLRRNADGTVLALCGQGPVPAHASIAAMRALGHELVPGTGLLPAVVPGAFDAWMLLLAEFGTIGLDEALGPAILYAARGIPVDERLHRTLSAAAPIFARDWPTSARLYLDEGATPAGIGGRLRNPALAATLQRILAEATAGSPDRDGRIEAARRIWSDGFVADAIDAFCRTTRAMDVSGTAHGAFLGGADLAGWRAHLEPALSASFAGRTVHKCGGWTQGPALLEAVTLLPEAAIAGEDPCGASFVHTLTETLKLALADRDTHYGDADDTDERLAALLLAKVTEARRPLVGDKASTVFRPTSLSPDDWFPDYAAAAARRRAPGLLAAYGGGEPTHAEMPAAPPANEIPPLAPAGGAAYLARAVGDTSYLAVADRHGNVVSATPSGGWLQSSPAIEALGFPLGTRAQMGWLDPDSPSALVPGKRPRTTLTPTIVTSDDGSALAVGTPGGDQQEQWQLAFLVRHLVHGMALQDALDAPGFHTNHAINSFYPRAAVPGSLVVEGRFSDETIAALTERGHAVEVGGDWSEGRLCAVAVEPHGEVRAAASTRGGQSLAVGR